MDAQDALRGPDVSHEGQSVVRSPATDNDQSEVADRQHPMHEDVGCSAKHYIEIMKLGLLIDTCQLPTEIIVAGITGVFGITSHVFYEICHREQLCDLAIRGFSGGSLVLDLVAESKETADRFQLLLHSGDLLRMMNDILGSLVTSRCISCGRFDSVRLVRFEIKRVDENEIELIRQSAEELRKHHKDQLLQIAQERQQVSSPPHTGQSEAASPDAVAPPLLKLKEAFSMEVVAMHVEDDRIGRACFVLRMHHDNPVVWKIGNLVHTYRQLLTRLESNDDSEISNVVQKLKKLIDEKVHTCALEVLRLAKELERYGRYPEAILMYQLSPACDEGKKVVNNFAYAIADCVNGLKCLTASVMGYDDELNTEKHMPMIKNHVIPIMREMLSKIRGTGCEMQEAWCLHFIEYALYCTEQWEFRKETIEKGLDLIRKNLGGREREHLLYSHLLNNLADNYKQISEYGEAMKYYEHALAAHHEVKNYENDEEKQASREQLDNNMKNVREKLSATQAKAVE